MSNDDVGSKGGVGVVFEILPGGKKDGPDDTDSTLHEVGSKAVTGLLKELLARQENETEALNRVIIISAHGKRGVTSFRMAGPCENGGLGFYDAMALLGICQAMMYKLMEKWGAI